ncbi:MAG TPA: hypothetical protein VMU94_28430 [Streptosporangiaceae bacterium]|nr:hypothetical protein [Streptosporangiaceae bacterium]
MSRPELQVLGDWSETPQPYERTVRHRLWKVYDRADQAVSRRLEALADRVATRRMRERAWAEGFAVALGAGRRTRWLMYLDEWGQGHDLAEEVSWRQAPREGRRAFLLPGLDAPAGDER